MSATVTDLRAGRLVELVSGMPGFPQLEHLVLSPIDDFAIFAWFVDPEQQSVSFLGANPFVYFPAYEVNLSDVARELLGVEDDHELIVYSLVSIDRDTEVMSVNLLAPLVVNTTLARAGQVVLEGDHPLRAPLPQPDGAGPNSNATALRVVEGRQT